MDLDSQRIICIIGLFLVNGLISGKIGGVEYCLTSCRFLAIYNFGDSNSDTGRAFKELSWPNGETFFSKPSRRLSNGRLIVDFIENLGLPYVSPYSNSVVGTNYTHGANFAVSGASINPPSYSIFHLDIQISEFIKFKSQTTALDKELCVNGRIPLNGSRFPKPEDFSKALYLLDIRQNDLAYSFRYNITGYIQIAHGIQYNTTSIKANIPNILVKFSNAVHQLYKEGARIFWVHNTGPHGCLPLNVIYELASLDEMGCVKFQNELSQEFNRQLKETVYQIRVQLFQATFTCVDVYSAMHALIRDARNLGFDDAMKFYCGWPLVACGGKAIVNGTEYMSCNDPSKLISWDRRHLTEAAKSFLAKLIVNGSLSDPPISITNTSSCHMHTFINT